MESQPQNPEFRINPKNSHPSNCMVNVLNMEHFSLSVLK